MVCDGMGSCGACSEGAGCTPSGQPCRTGTVSCASGSPSCSASGNTSPGTPCGTGMVCNGSGSCISCNDGASCMPSGQPCRTGTTSCASGAPVCNATGNASPGTACGGGRVCDGSGNCRASETCNGMDDDGNGIVDDGVSGCWRTVYRFRSTRGYPIEARCLGSSTSPPYTCSDYVYEREAFILYAINVPGTFEMRQCSRLTDHIVVDAASGARSTLQGSGYDCNIVLGYAYALGSGTATTPFPYTCPLYRFSYSTPGGGAKIFSVGADSTFGLTCESPARATVRSNVPCFSGPPSGC